MNLTDCQNQALSLLKRDSNVFLTGEAGTGKSFLIQEYLKHAPESDLLASTGAAAVLIEGRTFHSFFGLGILEGGSKKTIKKALKNGKLLERLRNCSQVVIDEVSMLSGEVLETAEQIARKARKSHDPWGGIRVVAVGDFAQLPPVNRYDEKKDWAFCHSIWEKSQFQEICLKTTVRFVDSEFYSILKALRMGHLSPKSIELLNERTTQDYPEDITHLYPRRAMVQKFNQDRLDQIDEPLKKFPSTYKGSPKNVKNLKKQAPIPEILELKKGAYIMMQKNDIGYSGLPGRWVNGSTGWIKDMDEEKLTIELVNGKTVTTKTSTFSLLDADGEVSAQVSNFPVQLAYASTIHKSQGQTLDRAVISLKNLWESGQAYVALSRLRSLQGLYLTGWSLNSFHVDSEVTDFYNKFQ